MVFSLRESINVCEKKIRRLMGGYNATYFRSTKTKMAENGFGLMLMTIIRTNVFVKGINKSYTRKHS